MDTRIKPLGRPVYPSTAHLSGSKLGPSDSRIEIGQELLATTHQQRSGKKFHRHVTVKLDGSCVGVARVNGELMALGRAGYLCDGSPHPQLQSFHYWFLENRDRFEFLQEKERVVGEWMTQVHSIRYNLPHEPFIAFDLISPKHKRTSIQYMLEKLQGFIRPQVLYSGYEPYSVEQMMLDLKQEYHGALDPHEGAVWRVQNPSGHIYVCKYVRPDFEPGKYFDESVPGFRPNSWV